VEKHLDWRVTGGVERQDSPPVRRAEEEEEEK
jgi:hypothetical protein